MTLIAPPAVHDAPPTAVEDAVIKEARRRARCRRVRQGIAVAAVGVAAVAALMGEVRALPAAAREVLSEAPPATVGHAGAHSRRAASGVTSLWNCLRVDGTELAALERGAVRVDHWRSGDDIVFARTTDGAKVTAHPLADHAARAVDRLGRMIDMTGERPKALSSHVLALTGGDPRGGLSPRPFDFASVKEVAEVRRTRRYPPAFVAAGILLGASRRCHPWLLRGRAAPNGRL